MFQSNQRILVQSLVGGTQIDFYIKCLVSLATYCKDPIQLLIHSDGSLSQKDREKILAGLGEINVLFPKTSETKEKTLDQLHGKPYCQKIRNESIWGIEFFDPLFSDPHDDFSYYIDADILFIRPFQGLFNRNNLQNGALFLRDTEWDAYSLKPWQLCGIGKKPKIVKGITTAVVCWDKKAIDWDYLEWFLQQTQYHRIKEWILPTAQAGLATMCNSKTVSSNQILNMYPNAKIKNETFGLHLLGSYRRKWLSNFQKHSPVLNRNSSPTIARFENCEPRNPFVYGIKQIKRFINTRLNKW